MAHPYVPSGGILQSAINQFRQSFPKKVDSETLKKLGIAPGNENGVINVLKFLNLTDAENTPTEAGRNLFNSHDDSDFSENLSKCVKASYSDLFDLRSENAWQTSQDDLISFFRRSDGSSAVVGKRQAITFQTLASLSGKRNEEVSARAPRNAKKNPNEDGSRSSAKKKLEKRPTAQNPNGQFTVPAANGSQPNVALTVRVEVNLPANASKEAYDSIFASIKKNLIDGAS
jgi:hypothetical protein